VSIQTLGTFSRADYEIITRAVYNRDVRTCWWAFNSHWPNTWFWVLL